eukprot:scaffold16556_cov133-Isochrysis_galbana.AAC.7
MACIHRMAYAWLMAGKNATAKAVWAPGAFTELARRDVRACEKCRARSRVKEHETRRYRYERTTVSNATVMARCGRRAETARRSSDILHLQLHSHSHSLFILYMRGLWFMI